MKRLKAALAALALMVGGAGWAGPVTLSVDQMRAFGQEALLRGFADQALEIAAALLIRDPGDAQALVLRAQALRVKGELAASEAAARAAWETAETDAERYGAATALAQALSLQDQRTRAQFWLRQAVEHAPSDAARAQAADDLAYVREQNPVSLQFSGMLRPSDNVNNGGKVDAIVVGPFVLPLPSTLKALSGTSWALGLNGRLRLADTGQARTHLTFGGQSQGAFLSPEARAIAPDLSNGDLTYLQLSLGVERQVDLATGQLVASATLGHSWYGGDPLADSLTGALTWDRTLAPGKSMHLGTSLAGQWQIADSESNSLTLSAEAGMTFVVAGGSRVGVLLEAERTRSESVGTDRTAWGATLSWQGAKPVAGLDLGASLSARRTIFANERRDDRLALGLQATVQKIEYLGFSPVLTLDMTQNNSTVAWFTSDSLALGISLTSRF